MMPAAGFGGETTADGAVFSMPVYPSAMSEPVGFSGILDLCTAPAVPAPLIPLDAPPPATPVRAELHGVKTREPIDEVGVTVILPETSPRSWLLDPVQELADVAVVSADDVETQADEVSIVSEPASIDGVTPELRGIAVISPLPAPEPEITPAIAPSFSGGSRKYVTDVTPGFQAATVSADLPPPVAPTIAAGRATEATALVVESIQSGSTSPRSDTLALPMPPVSLTPVAPWSRADTAAPSASTEKFAMVADRMPDRIGTVVKQRTDNKFLNIDVQLDANQVKPRGIVSAMPAEDMHATPAPTTDQPTFVQPRAVGANTDTVPVVVPSSAASAVTISHGASSEIVQRREISLPVADATSVVREVAELTHDFRMRERSAVEVKFNFKDETELSVRLAYRDGDVHTTFRTDSAELRAALAREWQGYAANVAQESRSYRIAEPAFTGSNSFSDAAQSRDSGSAAGGDARNRQQSPHADQPDSQRFASPAHGFRPQAPALGHRVSSDRLLHAFA